MPALRITGGSLKGLLFRAPSHLPVRPTTDRAKESLFNILNNRYDWENLNIIDLFSGTGNMSYEFISRGCKHVIAVEKHPACIEYIKEQRSRLPENTLEIVRSDVFSFLNQTEEKADIIFSDAPYALQKMLEIPAIVEQKNLLRPKGCLILEHPTSMPTASLKGFNEIRNYGQSSFSFFTFEK